MELITIILLTLLYIMLFTACFWLVVFLDNMNSLFKDPEAEEDYTISVIIPAYNEEDSILRTVESVLEQDYPMELFEVIVVNDGSTDNTRRLCEDYARKGLITLVNKENGGKASALNLGLKYAERELVYVLDADSYAEEDSFKQLTGYFDDEEVAVATSSMKVSKKDGLYEKIQWVEYAFSIMMRKVMTLFNSLYVTPGPGSLYRKSVLEEVGGFSEDTLTEDMEVAFNIQDHDYKIENSLNSMVLTNTPGKLREWIKQRRRWYVGFMEDSLKYKHFYFNPSKGFLGTFLLPSCILSTGILLFLTFYSVYKMMEGWVSTFFRLKEVNFDLLTMFQPFNFTNFFYGINIFSIISVIFLLLSIVVIYYSLKASKEDVDFKNNFLSYVSYAVLYSLFMSLFWTDSIIYKLFFRQEDRGWRNG